jgi:hypothetical protein
MGALAPLILPAIGGFAAAKVLSSATAPPKPVQAPPVPQAITPPSATADTTQASEQARKGTKGGLIQQSIVTGDLVPKTKKKTVLG